MQRAVLVRHHPYAIFAGCDSTFRACGCDGECGCDCILGGIDSNQARLLPTDRSPNAPEPRSQAGAHLSGDSYGRNNPSGCWIDAEHGVGFSACHPDSVTGYQHPVCGSTNFDRHRRLLGGKGNLDLLHFRLGHLPCGARLRRYRSASSDDQQQEHRSRHDEKDTTA